MIRSDTYYSAPSSLLRRAALYPALSAEEEHQLGVDGRAGSSSASERIILCNLRLAVTIARDYTGLGLTLDDLVSEGSIGLMKAASKFEDFVADEPAANPALRQEDCDQSQEPHRLLKSRFSPTI
jgi:DNA-directed RNA polymerase sigma subunit (sigma70/sigma32)